ncbi:MAG: cytochrome c5 family protein [Xanthomonadales bacterium]|nr:cytochrome c5 family protein [Xanthomonadales bacterium]
MTKHDATFMRHFSQIIAGLVVFTLILMVVAWFMHHGFYGEGGVGANDERAQLEAARVDERLKPMGQVYAGETGRAAMLAQAEAARQAAASQVAYGGTTDGSVIYGNLCSACHTAGVAGAPKLEQAAWSSRIGQGMDTLVKHAIEGFQGQAGIMPARGGNPSLTDEQVAATVQWMVDELK